MHLRIQVIVRQTSYIEAKLNSTMQIKRVTLLPQLLAAHFANCVLSCVCFSHKCRFATLIKRFSLFFCQPAPRNFLVNNEHNSRFSSITGGPTLSANEHICHVLSEFSLHHNKTRSQYNAFN